VFNSNPPTFAANIDMLMAMDALDLSIEARPDIVVLVSGDGDFAYLANKLRRRGIRVEAASLPTVMSGELKRAVNEFIDLRDFFDRFGKKFVEDDHWGGRSSPPDDRADEAEAVR
jgi:uncharacterized LabA/DUF88 family protein